MSHFARLDFFRKAFNYGPGSLGSASITTTQNFTGDRDYSTLTLATGALLNLNGWRLFVKDRLVLNNPDMHCINANGALGSSAVNQAGANGGTTSFTGVLPYGSNGGPGGNGTTTAGVAGTSGSAQTNLLGGNSGAGGASGAGSSGAGAAGGVGIGTVFYQQKTPDIHFLYGAAAAYVSVGGGGGAGGGGDSSNNGGGGSGGGGGAGICFIAAREIEFASCTNASLFVARGGYGGVGRYGSAGNSGGGGGGGGSGGGFVYLICDHIIGTCANVINVSGGNGGNGGAKAGSGEDGSGGVGGAYGGYLIVVHGRGLAAYQASNNTTVPASGITGGTGSSSLYTL